VTDALLETLLARISDSGLVDDPVIEDDMVHGRARLVGPDAVVTVTIDPELEDVPDPDPEPLAAATTQLIEISATRWTALIEEIAAEIEDAVVEDDEEELIEDVDLRDDLEIVSVVVFADATLLSFRAEKQFPTARVLVQLGEDLELENVEVVDGEDQDE
jgi:hypothetical protein